MKLTCRLAGLLAAFVLVAMSSGAVAASDSEQLRAAIERNWNPPVDLKHMEDCTIVLRLHVAPDGVVQRIEVLDPIDDPTFRTLAESARRAILITQNELGRLPIPPEKYSPTIIIRWPMKEICEQRGGC